MTATTITEAMTAVELLAECQSIAAEIGPKAELYASVNTGRNRKIASIGIYPSGIGTYRHEWIYGATWHEVLAGAREWATNHKQVNRNSIVRRMALAVIEITDEHGRCDAARLKAKDFGADEIKEFHEAACQRASEMCANAPFVVVFEPA